jgi:hypothetical protein
MISRYVDRALKTLLMGLLPSTGYVAGAFMAEEGARLDKANIAGHCKQEPKFNAYVAETSDGWHCFKENIENGKLSRKAIVLEAL